MARRRHWRGGNNPRNPQHRRRDLDDMCTRAACDVLFADSDLPRDWRLRQTADGRPAGRRLGCLASLSQEPGTSLVYVGCGKVQRPGQARQLLFTLYSTWQQPQHSRIYTTTHVDTHTAWGLIYQHYMGGAVGAPENVRPGAAAPSARAQGRRC